MDFFLVLWYCVIILFVHVWCLNVLSVDVRIKPVSATSVCSNDRWNSSRSIVIHLTTHALVYMRTVHRTALTAFVRPSVPSFLSLCSSCLRCFPVSFSTSTFLAGRQEGHPVCKNTCPQSFSCSTGGRRQLVGKTADCAAPGKWHIKTLMVVA